MYSEKQIIEIIEKNNFSTKICNSWDNSCLILVPNFKEYNFFFGHGKTPTCYAREQCYWDSYHRKISREIDFLSISSDIDKQYQYLTFCLNIGDIKVIEPFRKYNVSGYIEIHDLAHWHYSFPFETEVYIYEKKPIIYERNIKINLDVNTSESYLLSSTKLIVFSNKFGEYGLLPNVVKTGLSDVFKEN